MTAFKIKLDSDEPSSKVPGIKHKCLRRKSQRIYELLDPRRPGDVVSFDVGQIKAIVEMDGKLREDQVIGSVPAGYIEFAARFNEHATGPELFATFSYVHGERETCTAGSPIVWAHFLIDDSLVGWQLDLSSQKPAALSSRIPEVIHHRVQTKSSVPVGVGKVPELPQLRALWSHMKGALETTDLLAQFWIKRGAIEQRYASRLAKLAESTIGEREPSEFRDAIDGFRVEAARQAMKHNTLAMQIAVELEARCVNLQIDQAARWREVYEPSIKKLEETSIQELKPQSGISIEWKRQYRNIRHSLDLSRLQAMKDIHSPYRPTSLSSADDLDLDFGREFDPVWGTPARRKEWEALLSSCRKMETDRSQFMKELLSSFTDVLAIVRDSHDESYGTIIRTFDLFRPQEVVEDFYKNFGGERESQSFRNSSSGNISKRSGQERTTIPSEMLPSRPLPRPPASATETVAPLFYLKIAGKEKKSLEAGNAVAVSATSGRGLWAGQLLSSHDKNPGNCAVPLQSSSQINEDRTLSGPRPRAPASKRSIFSSSRLPLSRSGGLTSKRDGPMPFTLPKTSLPLTQALPNSQRGSRPTLPKLNTQFGGKPIRTCYQ